MKRASVALLLALTLLCVGISIVWQRCTAPQIEEAARQLQARTWLSVLPEGSYDNQPLQHPLALPQPVLAHSTLLAGYLATFRGKPSAVVLHTRFQGYAGPIQMLIAIAPDGRLMASRVLQQQETPGLGAQVAKPGTGWSNEFVGRSHGNTPESAWALKRDNGQFDQLAGASLTSRAVIHGIQDALRYFDEHARLWLTEGTPDE